MSMSSPSRDSTVSTAISAEVVFSISVISWVISNSFVASIITHYCHSVNLSTKVFTISTGVLKYSFCIVNRLRSSWDQLYQSPLRMASIVDRFGRLLLHHKRLYTKALQQGR